MAALRQEYDDDAQTETLRHLLSVLILKLGIPDVPRHGPAGLHARFRELLEREFATAHGVGHYAGELGYSPRTLGRATIAAVGETAKQIIHGRIALKARRLLAHTDPAISTIGRHVGFRDPSNFSAFFTNVTGETPTAFRRSQRPTAAVDAGAS